MAVSASKPEARYRSFRELTVWQKAMELAIHVHRTADQLPEVERYGLGRDLRKTARSIPANVAEGFNRHSRATYRLHVATALGSQAELETQLELANRLGYLAETDHHALMTSVATVGRLLHGLWRALADVPE